MGIIKVLFQYLIFLFLNSELESANGNIDVLDYVLSFDIIDQDLVFWLKEKESWIELLRNVGLETFHVRGQKEVRFKTQRRKAFWLDA